ncbi:hypothetical protein QOT17_013741 [Balamuthia mandrillaris]
MADRRLLFAAGEGQSFDLGQVDLQTEIIQGQFWNRRGRDDGHSVKHDKEKEKEREEEEGGEALIAHKLKGSRKTAPTKTAVDEFMPKIRTIGFLRDASSRGNSGSGGGPCMTLMPSENAVIVKHARLQHTFNFDWTSNNATAEESYKRVLREPLRGLTTRQSLGRDSAILCMGGCGGLAWVIAPYRPTGRRSFSAYSPSSSPSLAASSSYVSYSSVTASGDGLLRRAIGAILRRLDAKNSSSASSVSVLYFASFEIYNDRVYDLYTGQKLSIYESSISQQLNTSSNLDYDTSPVIDNSFSSSPSAKGVFRKDFVGIESSKQNDYNGGEKGVIMDGLSCHRISSLSQFDRVMSTCMQHVHSSDQQMKSHLFFRLLVRPQLPSHLKKGFSESQPTIKRDKNIPSSSSSGTPQRVRSQLRPALTSRVAGSVSPTLAKFPMAHHVPTTVPGSTWTSRGYDLTSNRSQSGSSGNHIIVIPEASRMLELVVLAPFSATSSSIRSSEQNVGFDWRSFKLTHLLRHAFTDPQTHVTMVTHTDGLLRSLPISLWSFELLVAAKKIGKADEQDHNNPTFSRSNNLSSAASSKQRLPKTSRERINKMKQNNSLPYHQSKRTPGSASLLSPISSPFKPKQQLQQRINNSVGTPIPSKHKRTSSLPASSSLNEFTIENTEKKNHEKLQHIPTRDKEEEQEEETRIETNEEEKEERRWKEREKELELLLANEKEKNSFLQSKCEAANEKLIAKKNKVQILKRGLDKVKQTTREQLVSLEREVGEKVEQLKAKLGEQQQVISQQQERIATLEKQLANEQQKKKEEAEVMNSTNEHRQSFLEQEEEHWQRVYLLLKQQTDELVELHQRLSKQQQPPPAQEENAFCSFLE